MNEIDLLTNNFSAQRLSKYLRLYAGDGNNPEDTLTTRMMYYDLKRFENN